MSTPLSIEHKYKENLCEIKLHVKNSDGNKTNSDFAIDSGRHVENIRNCDLFIEDYTFLVYLDVVLYKFHSTRRFDLKDLKNVQINYTTKDHCMLLSLPCLEDEQDDKTEKSSEENHSNKFEKPLNLWKLKRITNQCNIRFDNSKELLKLESNYSYGFAGKFMGPIKSFECDLDVVTRMPQPNRVSPLQRTIDREIDEMKNFSRDQYKLNFVELEIPDGCDNPMLFDINFKDCILSQEEECSLHNLTCKPELMNMPDEYDIMEIDCGLISILLAICYDIRFTSNETNCESGWTRSVLSATLIYFESFTSLKDVVVSFMRNSLIYPLHRNYELSQECIADCITALQLNSTWILKQLLLTRNIFEANERSVFNYYYIDDYIRYLSNPSICTTSHLQMLAHNLKNILLDTSKNDLGLGLRELEMELLKELIKDVHIASAKNNDDSKDCDHVDKITEDINAESCESDRLTDSEDDSSNSDTEEDSVIIM